MADLEIQKGGFRYACSLTVYFACSHDFNYPFDLTMHIFGKSIIVWIHG